MRFGDARQAWCAGGFVVVPEHLSVDDLAPALDELSLCFPTAAGFHDGSDSRRERFLDDEFNGIDTFPFTSLQLSLLAVHARIIDLVEALLGTDDVRIYSAEAWAKYIGAADYDQWLHRDFLNHTILVPTEPTEFQQVEMFVYLVDVPDDLGPPRLVPRAHTSDLPPLPNWHPPPTPTLAATASSRPPAVPTSTPPRCPPPAPPARWWRSLRTRCTAARP